MIILDIIRLNLIYCIRIIINRVLYQVCPIYTEIAKNSFGRIMNVQ